jgi:hypothetical protein
MNTFMKKLPLLFSLFFFQIAALKAQTNDSTKVVQEKKPNILKKGTYSINIPEGWKIMDNCQENLCSLLSLADTLGGVDRFTENINFTVEKLSSPSLTLDKYAAYSENYLPKVVKNFKVIERKKIKPTTFRLTYKGEKSGFSQTWRQYYVIKHQKIYILTFACETSKYSYYQPIVEPYLNSFKVF